MSVSGHTPWYGMVLLPGPAGVGVELLARVHRFVHVALHPGGLFGPDCLGAVVRQDLHLVQLEAGVVNEAVRSSSLSLTRGPRALPVFFISEINAILYLDACAHFSIILCM